MKHSNSAYKDAGVDIDAAAELVERIKPHIKKTDRVGVMGGVGGFGALFDLKKTGYEDPVLVSATDGVGTKIKVAIEIDRHDTIGIDLVAMCVNDLVVQGAEPLFFLDYFATGKLVNTVAEDVIKGIAEGCKQSGCALIGGETAEMPGLYATGEYDLAGFSVGAVERDQILTGQDISQGDVILGLASNGLHSNGFSLVRKIIKADSEYTYDSLAPFDSSITLGELILMPTRIYVKSILAVLKAAQEKDTSFIKGLAHITGGGLYENIPRILPDGVMAHLDANTWELPPIFKFLAKEGRLNPHDMARTLNCGIGMAVICPAEHVDEITKIFEDNNETVYRLGDIKAKDGEQDVVIHDIETAFV